ncbi:geranylgeranyl reductase family protein [Candidatus Micrarchaeota archaeon]|nr:geranylgeranyl reductase family protein [Candidatus Micrarchaeota archaeon]
MEKNDFDAIVVGASVVGSNAAYHLAKSGLDALVVEEHSMPGKFGKCSGLVSKKGLEQIGVDYSAAKVNEVRGATFFCRSQEFSVRSSVVKAIVLNRQVYDEACALRAKDAGAKFSYSHPATSFSQGDCVKMRVGESVLSAKALIGADGASSSVANAFDFPKISKNRVVLAYEAEFVDANPIDLSMVQLFFDQSFAGFFGWSIPCGDSAVRIGFGTTDYQGLEAGKKKLFSIPLVGAQLENASKCREFSHLIPLSYRKRTQKRNVMLCGDSAGQVKATTGGGIVFGSLCAIVAAEETAAFLREGKPIGYEGAWRRKFGRTLFAHKLLRGFCNSLGENSLSALMGVCRVFGAQKFFSSFGDMDFILSA